MEHILSLSYGKDSLACLGAIEELGWPLDRIVHAEVWATDTIPADLPPMVEYKAKADKIIKERWGIEVEHIRHRMNYQEMFYRPICRGPAKGKLKGWPLIKGGWCHDLKIFDKLSPKNTVSYIGIAADEPNRFHNLTAKKKSPLVEAEWNETYCRKWCEENDLLSPIYTTAARGGCWFCHNQRVDQLRLLRKNYPELWALMLKWDKDSPVTFKPGKTIEKQITIINADGEEETIFEKAGYEPGHTVHDFDERFRLEDEGLLIPGDTKFKWDMLKDDMLNYRWF